MSDANTPLLYYAPTEPGGLNEYAVEQIRAILEQDVKIIVVASPTLQRSLLSANIDCEIVELLAERKARTKLGRLLARISNLKAHTKTLVALIETRNASQVLFTAYAEYFSPFWAGPLRQLHHDNVRFGVVVHDPIRDFRLGPKWWHKRSISYAYSFVDVAFVHEDIELDMGVPVKSLEKIVIPHGIYAFPKPDTTPSVSELRNDFGIPNTAKLLLSFGHIRDGKNLDLAIEALSEHKNWHLLIAGSSQSRSQKSIDHYQEIARRLGVEHRCHFKIGYVDKADVWKYFEICDYVLLTYSSDFRSASGVLNMAVHFRKQVLGSSGLGPLKNAIEEYALGIWVQPDSGLELRRGITKLQNLEEEGQWDRYSHDNNWQRNAQLVLNSLYQPN